MLIYTLVMLILLAICVGVLIGFMIEYYIDTDKISKKLFRNVIILSIFLLANVLTHIAVIQRL